MTILIRKLKKKLGKIVIQKIHVSNLIHFQGEIVHFSLKNEALRSESVKKI